MKVKGRGERSFAPFFMRAGDLLRWARCWQRKGRILFFRLWQGDL